MVGCVISDIVRTLVFLMRVLELEVFTFRWTKSRWVVDRIQEEGDNLTCDLRTMEETWLGLFSGAPATSKLRVTNVIAWTIPEADWLQMRHIRSFLLYQITLIKVKMWNLARSKPRKEVKA